MFSITALLDFGFILKEAAKAAVKKYWLEKALRAEFL